MRKNQLVIFSLFLCLIVASSAVPASADISPTSITATLRPGESISETKIVTIPEGPVPKGDVIFALDLTGSMSAEIAAAKTQAIGIMTQLGSVFADPAFGVMSFMDYNGTYSSYGYTNLYGNADANGDYPYQLDEPITTNQTAVATTINGLVLGYGGDGPQDYTRVIHESYNDTNVGWRAGSIRFLIMFGDNVPHDDDFNAFSTGGDPGRDEIMFTGDDLDFQTTVAEAAAAGIKIITMDSGGSAAKLSFEYMANETGGLWVDHYSIPSPYTAIINMISDAITEVVSTVDLLQLSVDPVEFASWVTVAPTSYTNVSRPATHEFTVTITVPRNTPCGFTYEFEIWANGDGADYGRQSVSISVPCESGVGIPLFSDAIAILPIAMIFAGLIVRHRRQNIN